MESVELNPPGKQRLKVVSRLFTRQVLLGVADAVGERLHVRETMSEMRREIAVVFCRPHQPARLPLTEHRTLALKKGLP